MLACQVDEDKREGRCTCDSECLPELFACWGRSFFLLWIICLPQGFVCFETQNLYICKLFSVFRCRFRLLLIKNFVEDLICFEFPEMARLSWVTTSSPWFEILLNLHGLVDCCLQLRVSFFCWLGRFAVVEFRSRAAGRLYRLGLPLGCDLPDPGLRVEWSPAFLGLLWIVL